MSGKAALSGLFWNSIESVILQTVQLLVSMVLARLLTASDFGLIALISVFITLTTSISNGGYRSTIILRPNLTDIDYSTAFVYNLGISCFLYLLLFFTAPLIANFYNEPQLISLVRILSLVNLINAGYFVQDSLLQKQMQFKLLAKRNIMASFFSGCIAIAIAYYGFGAWSLVSLTLSRAVIINLYLWIQKIWTISFRFSFSSFKKHFNFGSRLMLSNITGILYNNLNNLLIGKYFSKADLGYYYQARKLQSVPIVSASGVLSKTSSPLLAKYQTDFQELHKTYSHFIRIAALIIIPIAVLMFVVSRDLIIVLFSAKWMNSIPIFRILILTGVFSPFIIINSQSPAIMGDSKFYLYYDSALKILYLTITFITIRFGLLVMITCQALLTFFQMIINSMFVKKFYRIALWEQVKMYLPYMIYSMLAGSATFLTFLIPGTAPLFRVTIGTIIFSLAYVSMVYVFERKTFYSVIQIASSGIKKIQEKST